MSSVSNWCQIIPERHMRSIDGIEIVDHNELFGDHMHKLSPTKRDSLIPLKSPDSDNGELKLFHWEVETVAISIIFETPGPKAPFPLFDLAFSYHNPEDDEKRGEHEKIKLEIKHIPNTGGKHQIAIPAMEVDQFSCEIRLRESEDQPSAILPKIKVPKIFNITGHRQELCISLFKKTVNEKDEPAFLKRPATAG